MIPLWWRPSQVLAYRLPNGVAADSRGRIVYTSGKQLLRFDPATRLVEALAGPGTSRLNGSGPDDGIAEPTAPAFDANGDLLFCDTPNKQVKRIKAADL